MRWHRVLAWGLLAAFVAAFVGAVTAGTHPAHPSPISLTDALWAAAFVGFPAAGALVASRFPRNPLGWLLCVAPVLLMSGVWAGDQAHVLEGTSGSQRDIELLTWAAQVLFESGIGPLIFLPLLLPDGRLPSRRWRPAAFLLGLTIAVSLVSAMIRPGRIVQTRVDNPFGIEAAAGLAESTGSFVGVAMPSLMLLGLVSIFIRFRRASGVERQQLKWIAFGAATLLGFLALFLLIDAFDLTDSESILTLLFLPMILAIPISMGIAMLRYRLYDVDLVINKTLVYVSLSAILAFAYLAIVVILQGLFGDLIQASDLAVAGSTLAVAALFRPLRARVQGFIDRRFYRSRYDAAETLGAFSTRLRDEVDIESLRTDIVDVVRDTMQPSHASLWLRGGGG